MAITEVLIFLTTITIVWYILVGRKGPLDHIPGPKGLPWLGNVPWIDPVNPRITFLQWSKDYGEVFKIKVFGVTRIITNSYDSIYEVLVTKGKDFAGRPRNDRTELFARNNTDIFFQPNTPNWNLLRKTAHKHIKMYASGMPRIEKVAMGIISEMVLAFRKLEGQVFNPKDIIRYTIFNITSLFAVGKQFREGSEEYKLFEQSAKMLFQNLSFCGKGSDVDDVPWVKYFGQEAFINLKKYAAMRDKLMACLSPFVETNLNSKEHEIEHIEAVMFALLRLYNGQQEGTADPDLPELEKDNIETAISDLLYAGVESTMSSYYSFLNAVAQNPKVQETLQEEADFVIGQDRPVALSDREYMPYTKATVLEIGRFASVIPLGIAHTSTKDTSICGFHVPAGTDVVTNLYALHHEEDFWGDPYTFRPDRFLDDEGQLLLPSSDERRHLMPFGAGTRVCVGEILAQTRLFLLVATTSQVFNVKPGEKFTSCDPRHYSHGAIAYTPEYEIKLECRNNKLFTEAASN